MRTLPYLSLGVMRHPLVLEILRMEIIFRVHGHASSRHRILCGLMRACNLFSVQHRARGLKSTFSSPDTCMSKVNLMHWTAVDIPRGKSAAPCTTNFMLLRGGQTIRIKTSLTSSLASCCPATHLAKRRISIASRISSHGSRELGDWHLGKACNLLVERTFQLTAPEDCYLRLAEGVA